MTPHSARRLARPSLLLWMILLLAFGLRVYRLGAESLWYDEAYSAMVARTDWVTAQRMMLADLNPPLHSLLLRASVSVFGAGEFAVRFVSVFLGVLIVPLMWALARRLFDGTAAWIAMLLVCIAPLFVWYAREARSYGQATTLGVAAAYALVRAQSESRGKQSLWWAAFVVFALGAVYSHYLALYLIAALGVFWLIQIKSHISHLKWLAGWGTTAFGLVVLGIVVSLPRVLDLTQSSHIYWPGQLDVPEALISMARAMVVWRIELPVLADALVILCSVIALIAVLHAASSPANRRGVLLACLVVLVGMALMLAGIYRRPKFEPRYGITLAPFAWLLVAAGVNTLSLRYARVGKVAAALTMIALVGGLSTSSLSVLSGASPRDDWRGAVAYIRQNMRPNETIVLVSGHAFPTLAYYDSPVWVALPDDPVLDVTHILDYGSVAPALNRIQNQSPGVWLLLWQDEVVDPTQVVPALLADVGTELPVKAEFTGLRLRHFALDRPARFPLEPSMTNRLDRSPLKGLTALGFTLTPQPLPADAPLAVRMFWRADAIVGGAAGGSLRVLDGQGNEWARRDELLGGSLYSERWPPSEWIMRQYTISLPIATPPGIYQLKQIVYRGSENGELDLGMFVVTRPEHEPDPASLSGAFNSVAHWGDLGLLSVGLDQRTIKPCEPLDFSAMWRTETPPAGDYALRVMFAGQSSDQPLAAGFPTTQWRPGDIWRTRHHIDVPCRALDGPEELRLALLDSDGRLVAAPLDAGSVKIQSGRVFTRPAIQHLFVSDLGGQVRLLGYDLKPQAIRVKSQIELTLYWQATREMTQSMTVMTHVEGDRLWGQHDGLPVQGLEPTDRWVTNEIVADRHVIAFDPATPPGKYRLVIGMYNPVTLVRVPAFDANGARWPNDGVVLQDINVMR